MSFFIPKCEIIKQIKFAFSSCGLTSEPVLFHFDIGRIGILDKVKARHEMLDDYLTCLLEVSENRTFLIPTFNYDYCRTRLYDVDKDPSQVGLLNDYIRMRRYPRSKTPIFNFCFLNNHSFSLNACNNPFGANSTFGELLEQEGWIGFFGAEFEAATFLHFMEDRVDVPYRYIKQFSGEIIEGSTRSQITLEYRVRPQASDSADPRWNELKEELLKNGILKAFPLGNGILLLCRARTLREYWFNALAKDEFYFLTEKSRAVAKLLLDRYGHPLTVENVERAL